MVTTQVAMTFMQAVLSGSAALAEPKGTYVPFAPP